MTGVDVSEVDASGPDVRAVSGRVRELRDPRTIRQRAERLFTLALEGSLPGFTVDLGVLPELADKVARLTREQYPDLRVPTHGRFRHFDVGSVARLAEVRAALSGEGARERARSLVDLVVVSVLLDAGAGDAWSYVEPATGLRFARSEGLAVASLRSFLAGAFAGPGRVPFRVDAGALRSLDQAVVTRGFQVGPGNPLAGVDGRTSLLRSLGAALEARPDLFGAEAPRPGGLVDALAARADGNGAVPARVLLGLLLEGLASIWPGRVTMDGENLGDVWPHPALGAPTDPAGLVPFHKLSQWLAYSLVEPLAEAGVHVTDLADLTGLAEYRNGGLFLDGGALRLRDASEAERAHAPGEPLVVAWRALTLALLDRLHPLVAERLGLTTATFPMGCLLEGGTWGAGRALAREKREGGGPPLRIESDGTVF